MERLHARYPFLSGGREAVREADVDLATLAATDDPAVERGVERVLTAIDDGTVGEPRRPARVELLSYPVARVLVSLVGEEALTRRYARAEARTAAERLREDAAGPDLRSADRIQLSLRELLAEFDLAGRVRERDDGRYGVHVSAYLSLAAGQRGEQWRLVNRELADGEVPVTREELFALLETAVEHRVGADLPFGVPEQIAEQLVDEQDCISERLAAVDLDLTIETVKPEAYPPCMTALLDRIREGDPLAHHSRFAITAFLASIGMAREEIVDHLEAHPQLGAEPTANQVDHLRGDTGAVEYTPPTCATMQQFGDCVNMDARCETIAHPLAYYEVAVSDGDTGGEGQESQTPER